MSLCSDVLVEQPLALPGSAYIIVVVFPLMSKGEGEGGGKVDKIIINWNIPNFDKVNKGGGA